MERTIFPEEFLEDSIESHLGRFSRRSDAVYLGIVALVLGGIAILPLVRVDVAARGAGIIRPVTEKQEVRARTSGLVDQVFVQQGQEVTAGQVLLTVRAQALSERRAVLETRLADTRVQVLDLERLVRATSHGATDAATLTTARYRQELVALQTELNQARLEEERLSREVERERILHARQISPARQLEEREFEHAQARAHREAVVARHLNAWQAELVRLRPEVLALEAELGQVAEEHALFTVIAPVDGSIEELRSLAPGSFLQGGEVVAVLSPSDHLVAEMHVSPRDVGLLRPGMPVRMHIDAFNYTDWGFVTGTVTEISDDYLLVGAQPTFRVRASLEQDRLALPNGVEGRLRKGMTLQARFQVARRSLFQLLRDNVNDWMNPAHTPVTGS